jgi:hypothetical protein
MCDRGTTEVSISACITAFVSIINANGCYRRIFASTTKSVIGMILVEHARDFFAAIPPCVDQ